MPDPTVLSLLLALAGAVSSGLFAARSERSGRRIGRSDT
jgi:hypothetical protein